MTYKNEALPHLTNEEIQKGTKNGAKKYENLSFFEEYSMFMGVAQILEFGLKKLLQEKFQYDLEKMEKWSLGRTTNELEKNGLREDFIYLLKSLIEYRNYIAHELLFDDALTKSLLGNNTSKNHYGKSHRTLHKAILEHEQLVFLFDWTNTNKGWD
jgi:hypothetical protein